MTEETEKINWKLYSVILLCVPVLFGAYTLALLWLTWPISELSISKSGTFGDSFGGLTALFSGLAFAGMIITIHLQYKELKLQRIERSEHNEQFKRTAIAQEETARLSALSTLLEEYKYILNLNHESLQMYGTTKLEGANLAIHNENIEIYKKRKIIITQLEKHLGIENERRSSGSE